MEMDKGLTVDSRGYLTARLMVSGRVYSASFGRDSVEAREIASLWLSDRRKEKLLGKLGLKPELQSLPFARVAMVWYAKWSVELDPEGRPAHRDPKASLAYINRIFIPYFGKMVYDTIKPKDVQEWRDRRVQHVLGTSVNREQAILSSIFSHIERWVKAEAIKPFKIPAENPCSPIEKAPNRVRQRVLTVNELKALKASCLSLQDSDLWEICEMGLKSMLRKKDLFNLEAGIDIDINQAKTQRHLHLPMSVIRPLKYKNFRRRWESARESARLVDVQFRDLRKTGANLLKSKNYSNKVISEVLGHASTQTTEIYMVKDVEHLKKPLQDLDEIIKEL